MSDAKPNHHFLSEIIAADVAAGKNQRSVVTRFPPEPNGFLHIGHSKSILLNFGLGKQFGGRTHLRFDDTNPTTEDTLYVESIQNDVRWLGADWGSKIYYASDFFEQMFECAIRLIREGKAYVDSQTVEQIREGRGSFEKPGTNSPFRNRSVEENLELFQKMRSGEFPDGACVLRAKIDMAHPNVLLRDPLLYRIRHAHHHRTGDKWCIYPMYDFAHPLEDALEGVTHSICTLEFESNRELYDWVLDNLGPWSPRPRQYEFARLALGYTVMSKRKLLQLVTEKRVSGWDDPRMPTIAGMRRRGVTSDALRAFNELIGVAKNNSVVDIGKLEFAIRQDLDAKTHRALAVLNPLKVVLTNWPEAKTDELDLAWWPFEPERAGTRPVPFGRELFIERDDFSEAPPKGWKRLALGQEVRLMGAYVIRCDEVVKDSAGQVAELRCTVDLNSRGGEPADHRKVGGALHWVHATKSVPVEVRLYDRLFTVELPDAEGDFLAHFNPESLTIAQDARVEPALAVTEPGTWYQFLRLGYFYVDPMDSKRGAPVFNRTIGLKDNWTKPVAAASKVEEKKPAAVAGPSADKGKPKKGRAEVRAERRAVTPSLSERYAHYQSQWKLSEPEADLLTGDLELANFFDAALASGASPKLTAQWLLNEMLGAAKDQPLSSLPLTGTAFGQFVTLVEKGRVTPASAKALLSHLVEKGGDPEAKLKALGLEKREDTGALTAAVSKVLQEQSAEVTRYRAGEKKLFGVLMGSVMRELQGAADAAKVREALTQQLG